MKLWCAATLKTPLGNCPKDVKRIRFSCLACRMRRWIRGRFTLPSYYIKYTYRNVMYQYLVDEYQAYGYRYRARSGRKLLVTRYCHVLIDPRGHFTRLRCAFIQVMDSLMGIVKQTKPLIEFAEFAANYPVW